MPEQVWLIPLSKWFALHTASAGRKRLRAWPEAEYQPKEVTATLSLIATLLMLGAAEWLPILAGVAA